MRRGIGHNLLAAFFVLFVLFLYGPTLTIAVLSFQGPDGGPIIVEVKKRDVEPGGFVLLYEGAEFGVICSCNACFRHDDYLLLSRSLDSHIPIDLAKIKKLIFR